MLDHDADADVPGGGGVWSVMGFANPAGDVVEAWLCPLPVGFAHRVVNDPDALGREVAGRASAEGGEVIECGQITVDGRLAYYRVVRLPVRLPAGELPNAAYAVGLVVPVEDPSASSG